MNFASTTKYEPASAPGVTVTLRRIGPRKRAEIELKIADARAKQRCITAEYFAAKEALDALLLMAEKNEDGTPVVVTPEMSTHALKIAASAESLGLLLNAQIRPAYLEAGIVSIEGAELTAADLCDSGPDDLFMDLSDFLMNGAALPSDLTKNSESPITSPAVGDGAMNSTTAGSADSADSGFTATAANSPSTP